MRRKLLEADLIEAVIGLGPNLFYNSPMEACVVVCRTLKPAERRHKVLFINAVNEVTRERAQSFLTDDHIARIADAYARYADEPGLARVASLEQIRAQDGNLSIPLYVSVNGPTAAPKADPRAELAEALESWLASRLEVAESLRAVLPDLPLPTEELSLGALEESGLFDRTGWERVRFGDIVENVTDRVEPADVPESVYVGLEHLDPQDLHIRRRGKGSDVIGTKLGFCTGDIIFGRRRAYQRKLAVAEFDGICSAHAMVLRARSELVLPEFLPFLMMSDHFMNRAVDISVGSLSPTINWRTLQREEFELPPLEQQRRIAALLWAVDEAGENMSSLDSAVQSVKDARLSEFLYRYDNWPEFECRDLLKEGPRNGFSPRTNTNGRGLPTLSISAVRNGEIITEGNIKYANVDESDVSSFLLRSDDILVVRGNGNRSLCGRAGIVRSYPPGCFYPDLLIRIRFDASSLLQEFAVLQWNEPRTHVRLLSRAKSTNGIWKVNGSDVRSHRLRVPPLSEQRRFLADSLSIRILHCQIAQCRNKVVSLGSGVLGTLFRREI